MLTLQCVMPDYNAYMLIYQHTYEVLQMYDTPDYTVKLCVVPGNDPHCYNLLTADKVGVILPSENLFQDDHHDIILYL